MVLMFGPLPADSEINAASAAPASSGRSSAKMVRFIQHPLRRHKTNPIKGRASRLAGSGTGAPTAALLIATVSIARRKSVSGLPSEGISKRIKPTCERPVVPRSSQSPPPDQTLGETRKQFWVLLQSWPSKQEKSLGIGLPKSA